MHEIHFNERVPRYWESFMAVDVVWLRSEGSRVAKLPPAMVFRLFLIHPNRYLQVTSGKNNSEAEYFIVVCCTR